MCSDATKRASRKRTGLNDQEPTGSGNRLSKPAAMECDLAGLEPMRAYGSGPDFLLLLLG